MIQIDQLFPPRDTRNSPLTVPTDVPPQTQPQPQTPRELAARKWRGLDEGEKFKRFD